MRTSPISTAASRSEPWWWCSRPRNHRHDLKARGLSFLRHARETHAFINAFASRAVGWIVAHSSSRAAKGESRIERKPGSYRRPRLFQLIELGKRGGKLEMRKRIIPIGLKRPA